MSDKTQMMTQWWHSPLGQHVLSQEQQLLQSWSRHFYGHFQLQLYGEQKLLPDVSHPCCQTVMASQADLDGKAELLPLKSHSVDNLLIPHVLEFHLSLIKFYVKLNACLLLMVLWFYVALIRVVYGDLGAYFHGRIDRHGEATFFHRQG